jgi:RNA polymerase sigma-70 factor (ECF subfamily)
MPLKPKPDASRLTAISTNWEEIIEARGDASGDKRNRILIRYASCVYTYILQACRNADTAEELSQEFALRFVRGDYKNADPSKGRFRDYLRASLRNLIADQYRKNKEVALNISSAERLPDESTDSQLADLDREFHKHWREQVLRLTWNALRESDSESGRSNDYYTVLHYRSLNPNAKSSEMADALTQQLGRSVNAEWVRQKLSRARKKFADLLATEVRRSLSEKTEEAIREELAALGLLKYID